MCKIWERWKVVPLKFFFNNVIFRRTVYTVFGDVSSIFSWVFFWQCVHYDPCNLWQNLLDWTKHGEKMSGSSSRVCLLNGHKVERLSCRTCGHIFSSCALPFQRWLAWLQVFLFYRNLFFARKNTDHFAERSAVSEVRPVFMPRSLYHLSLP